MSEPRPAEVFVTVGTDHHPFDRLIDAIDGWMTRRGGEEVAVFVQHGTSRPPRVAKGAGYVSHEEMDRRMREASAVVCHGGPGTIFDCLHAGRKPIVVPRRHASGEHVDDHQVRFARYMSGLGFVKLVESEAELGALLEASLAGSAEFLAPPDSDRLSGTTAAFEEIVGTTLGIRPPTA